MVIKHTSFDHGWYYHYRVNLENAKRLLQDYQDLNQYLLDMFHSCPHNYFLSGPRSSSLKMPMKGTNALKVNGHAISDFARHGLKANSDRFKSNHSKVQVFMLENDKNTVAIEVPLWMEPDELNSLSIMQTSKPLTGHIDILRVEENKIWVWDFKPRAEKEVYAKAQTYSYALMLSRRTGIGLENFRCGYFDHDTAFVFKPETVSIKRIQKNLA